MNVLVFPCGSELGLEVHRSLIGKKCINLIGLSSVDDHGSFVFDNYIGGFPFVDSEGFIDSLKHIIDERNVDVIYPCTDSVLIKCKEYELHLCKVVGPDISIVKICNSKKLTYEKLKDVCLVPQIYKDNIFYPAFLKPDVGYGSRNCFVVKDANELIQYYQPYHLVMEYIPGKEYTVDCFADQFAEGRERVKTFKGISVDTRIVKDHRFCHIAKKIHSVLNFPGAWFFQVKENANGQLVLMEVGARFGGSSALNRLRGVNFALLNLYPGPVRIKPQQYITSISRSLDVKAKINYDFQYVYVDLDDTLTINGKVNYKLMGLLYKYKNEGKHLFLLTRNKGDIERILSIYCIDKSLFSIIKLEDDMKKRDYISYNSIFFDDSFREREDAPCPTFDTDVIDSFL